MIFGFNSVVAILSPPSLVEETLVALALPLVRLAFLTAMRLLIRDFFSIDIVRSFLIFVVYECPATLHRDCQTTARRPQCCFVVNYQQLISFFNRSDFAGSEGEILSRVKN